MRAEIELICEYPGCNKPFIRRKAEINRCKERGLKSYCSRSCTGKAVSSNLGKYRCNLELANKALKNNDRNGPLSPFRKFVRTAESRAKKKTIFLQVTITAKYLLELWKSQNGKCPFTGWDM